MSEIRQIFKLLLKKSFYDKHKDKIPDNAFDEIGKDLLCTLKDAHNKYNRDLSTEEIYQLYCAEKPTLTTANKNTVEVYLANVKDEPDLGEDVGETVYSSLWRQEVGRVISQYGIRLIDGDNTDLDLLTAYINSVSTNFIPDDGFDEPVNTDPETLFNRLKQKGKWSLNIPTLGPKIGKLSEGNFIVIMARPEAGKSACVIHMIAAKDGFAAQGAKVLYVGNEESAEATAGRAICCFSERSFVEIQTNPAQAKTEAWETTRNRLVFIHKPEISLAQLDMLCKKYKPDVIVVDQLDHLITKDTYGRGDERLGAIYRRAREVASKYECVFIGVSQASAEAEGRSRVTFSMSEGSKTSKAAAADLIVGIGKVDETDADVGNSVIRHFTVSKNKISGWHGTVTAKLIQDESRLVA